MSARKGDESIICEAIYFTKENNEKKIVGTASASRLSYLVQISEDEKKIFQKTLGHPLKNLFININGQEYKLIKRGDGR